MTAVRLSLIDFSFGLVRLVTSGKAKGINPVIVYNILGKTRPILRNETMKRHILIYESIEVSLKYPLNLILPLNIAFYKATAICHFFSSQYLQVRNKSTALWKVLFTIFVTHWNVYVLESSISYCMHFLFFSKNHRIPEICLINRDWLFTELSKGDWR